MTGWLLFSTLVGVHAADVTSLDGYPAAWQRALALERGTRYAAAAAALEPYADGYAEDYTLQLQLGWLHFLAADYAGAETYYGRAAALSRESLDAELGLGWTALRRGRYLEARDHFEEVLARDPSNASAREGLGLLPKRPATQLVPVFAGTLHVYGNHPEKRFALGASAGLASLLSDRWLLGATFRHSQFVLASGSQSSGMGSGMGRSGGYYATASFPQEELYVSAGTATRRFGALVQYAYVSEPGGDFGQLDVFGASLRASVLGDLLLDGTWSRYPDMPILRLAPAWRVPLGDAATLTPSLAFERASGESYWTGSLSLSVSSTSATYWVGGKYGDELRPAYLYQTSIFNIPETIAYGAWAGASFDMGDAWSLTLAYELHHLTRVDATTTTPWEGDLHLVSVALGRRFE